VVGRRKQGQRNLQSPKAKKERISKVKMDEKIIVTSMVYEEGWVRKVVLRDWIPEG